MKRAITLPDDGPLRFRSSVRGIGVTSSGSRPMRSVRAIGRQEHDGRKAGRIHSLAVDRNETHGTLWKMTPEEYNALRGRKERPQRVARCVRAFLGDEVASGQPLAMD